MNNQEEEYIVLRNYNTFWRLPTMIYSVMNFRLPFTLTASKAIYFFMSLAAIIALLKIPGISMIKSVPYIGNPVVLYLVYPAILTGVLDNYKIDGKMPYQFAVDMINFFISPWRYENHLPVTGVIKRTISIKIWYRRQSVKNRIEMLYKKEKPEGRLMISDGKRV